jgi:hypothetical protein
MVAINFKKEFVGAILAGDKAQTIRPKARCKVGDTLQLYTGQRTKYCKKISDAICTDVTPIEIHDAMIKLNGRVLQMGEMASFVKDDGFKHKRTDALNVSEFISFFEKHYALAFKGFVIKWKLEPTNNNKEGE